MTDQRTLLPPPAPATTPDPRRTCQAMTVCVPLVAITGDSYRLREHQARNNQLARPTR